MECPDILLKYEYFIFDWDGVLWDQDHPIDGAIEFIQNVLELGKKVFFVTNSSWRGSQAVYAHYQEIGFAKAGKVDPSQFYSAASAAVQYCKEVLKSKKIFVFGQGGVIKEARKAGLEVVEPSKEMLENSRCTEEEFSQMQGDDTIDTVLWGYTYLWSYRLLWYTSILLRGGANFVASNIDNVFSTKTRQMPGGGSIMTLLQHAGGKDPVTCGKPSKELFHLLWQDHNLESESLDKFIMIGDKLDTDIKFGNQSGIDTWLLFSGVTSEEKFESVKDREDTPKPTYTAQSLKHLLP